MPTSGLNLNTYENLEHYIDIDTDSSIVLDHYCICICIHVCIDVSVAERALLWYMLLSNSLCLPEDLLHVIHFKMTKWLIFRKTTHFFPCWALSLIWTFSQIKKYGANQRGRTCPPGLALNLDLNVKLNGWDMIWYYPYTQTACPFWKDFENS